jgi:opacity protein-like surface antigen
MRTIIAICFVTVLLGSLAAAQVPTAGNVFFGYSYYNTDISTVDRPNMNGWEGSLEGKVLPFIGIVADYSAHYGSETFPTVCPVNLSGCPVNSVNVHEQNYLFGPRVSVSLGRVRPFAEALFGAGRVSSNGAGSDTSFATALGGGIDYRIIKPIAWRFEGDYVQTRFFGATQNNLRLSTGIVVRF